MAAVEVAMKTLNVDGRADAEAAISDLVAQGQLGFVLAVLATHVPEINEEDGYDEGDRVLAALAQRLAGPEGFSRELFRWSATSFVIVSRSLRKIQDAAADGIATAMFAAWPGESPRALFDRIDEYIASRLAYGEPATSPVRLFRAV
jgi:GGDEF domain-containing protein